MLEQHPREVLPRCTVQVLEGSPKKGEATDAFADAVSKCISKGVCYYTNLPARASSPRNKRKGGGGHPKNPDSHQGWVLRDAH